MTTLYPNAVQSVAAWTVTLAIVFGALVLTCSGCVSAAAIEQARTEQALNLGHANDGQLPPKARLIGKTNHEAWSAQLYNLTGDRLPPEVEADLAARGTLPDGYKRGGR